MLSENIKAGTSLEDLKARLIRVLQPRKSQDNQGTFTPTTNAGISTDDSTGGVGQSGNAPSVHETRNHERNEASSSNKGKQRFTPDEVSQGSDTGSAQNVDPFVSTGASNKIQRETWLQEQKKRKQEALAERNRILKQIEDDKQERKQRERERKAAATAANESTRNEDQSSTSQATAIVPPKSRLTKECALKIRTFDGSTIASKFPSNQSLREDVRPWIKGQMDKLDVPYEFTHVLAPLPNRRINVSEEEESLQSLGLAPSATLVMVPIKSFTEAYAPANQGYISSGLSYGYGLVKGGFSLAGSLASSVLGGGESAPSQGRSPSGDGTAEVPRSSINVRTLGDQARSTDDQQLYNGNQLNFEPRRGSDDDKED